MPLRNTSPDFDPRERFVLYRLCDCPTCEGKGKDPSERHGPGSFKRCPDCRGEGRVRQEVASCETPAWPTPISSPGIEQHARHSMCSRKSRHCPA